MGFGWRLEQGARTCFWVGHSQLGIDGMGLVGLNRASLCSAAIRIETELRREPSAVAHHKICLAAIMEANAPVCGGHWGSRRPAAVRRRVAAAPLRLHWQCTPGAERLPCTTPQQRAWGVQLRGSRPLLPRAYFGERHVCMVRSVTCAPSPGLGRCPLQLHNVGKLRMRPARSGAHHRPAAD